MSKKIIALIITVVTVCVVAFIAIKSQNDFVIIVNEEKVSRDDFQRELDKILLSGDIRDEELIRQELVERTTERLVFSSYLKSLEIEVTEKELTIRYQLIADGLPDVNTAEELRQKWEEEGVDLYLLDKQFTEEIAYDKIFSIYLAQEQLPRQEIDDSYENYLRENSDLQPMSREEFTEQFNYQLVYQKIEEEKKAFQEKSVIEINL